MSNVRQPQLVDRHHLEDGAVACQLNDTPLVSRDSFKGFLARRRTTYRGAFLTPRV